MFPLLLLVFDAFRCSAGGRIGLATWARARWLRYHAPYWAVLAGAVLVAAASVPRYGELSSFSLTLRSPWESLFVQGKALTFGLSLFVRPAQLNVDHDLAAASFDDPLAWTAGAGILSLCAAALFAARRMPLASLGVVWFFVAALPANGPIARLDLLSERNLYLPMAGLALTAAALYSALHSALGEALPLRALPAARRVLALCALCVIAVLGWATVERNALWADPVALWSDAVAKSPRKSRAHDNLGYALEMRGELEGAMREYRHALELEPTNMRAWKNLRRVWDATARD